MAAEGTASVLADRYELERLLGRGGMGEVWAAHDRRLGRRVAVKLLLTDLARQPAVRRRFETEARAAARLSHPNVVAVFDTGEDDEVPYLVMECLPGPSLADVLRDGPMPPPAARSMALQVLAALGAAHSAGMVHRDVKPGNILRAGDHWKVVDFGIAKSAEDVTDLTATGSVLGTPAYLAPERLHGQPATPSTDLYATGVVLYESLAGRKPFTADTPIAMAHQIATLPPEPLAELCPQVEPHVAAAVERAMAKDPAQRFSSTKAMTAALGGGHPTEPAVAPAPLGPTERTRELPAQTVAPAAPATTAARRWPAVVALLVLAAVAAVLVAVLLARAGDDSPGEPADLPEAQQQLRDEIQP